MSCKFLGMWQTAGDALCNRSYMQVPFSHDSRTSIKSGGHEPVA